MPTTTHPARIDGFVLTQREGGECWLHFARPMWIVRYPATDARAEHYQAYRAVMPVLPGRKPWSVDNRRIGGDRGFATLEQAVRAARYAEGL